MQKKQFAVVDDLATDRAALAQRVDSYMTANGLEYELHQYESAEDFLAEFRTRDFDVVFMDVYMDGMDGLSAAAQVRAYDRDCKLVFLTSCEAHVWQALSIGICHYLVKPIQEGPFEAAMKNCCVLPSHAVPTLEVVVDKKSVTLDTGKILYIEKTDRFVCIHMTQQTLQLSDATFSVHQVTQLLSKDERFLVPIRGTILNMDRVSDLTDDGFLMQNGDRISINVRGKKAVLSAYQHYVMQQMRGVR